MLVNLKTQTLSVPYQQGMLPSREDNIGNMLPRGENSEFQS